MEEIVSFKIYENRHRNERSNERWCEGEKSIKWIETVFPKLATEPERSIYIVIV